MSEAESDAVCYVCEKVESNTSRLIECVQCGRSAHFRCKKLFGNAIARAKKKPYMCSVECSELYSHINQTVNLDAVVAELHALNQGVNESKKETSQLRYVVDQSRLQLATLVKTSGKIEESQQFLSNQFELIKVNLQQFREDMDAVKTENIKIRGEVSDWQKKHNELSVKVNTLEVELDKANRQLVAKNAVILGLPLNECEDTKQLVYQLCAALGYALDESAVVAAKRLTGKNTGKTAAPILVTFREEKLKEEFFEHKRKYGPLEASVISDMYKGSTNRVSIRDEMTSFGRALLQYAKSAQSTLGAKYIWPGRNGKVLIRRHDGDRVEQIGSKQELEQLPNVSSKRSLNSSISAGESSQTLSPQTSPQIQHLAKRTR